MVLKRMETNTNLGPVTPYVRMVQQRLPMETNTNLGPVTPSFIRRIEYVLNGN